MSVSHLLEDFGALSQGDLVEMTDVLLEEERLEAFEKGYQAGWDDSSKAQADEAGRVSAEFTQSIADLSLTYEEAFHNLLEGVRPVLKEMVQLVLPSVAHETLAPRLSEIIAQHISETGRREIEIIVAPGHKDILDRIDFSANTVPFSLREDPSVGPDQTLIRFEDGTEQEIDLNSIITQINAAIDTYFDTGSTEEQRKSA